MKPIATALIVANLAALTYGAAVVLPGLQAAPDDLEQLTQVADRQEAEVSSTRAAWDLNPESWEATKRYAVALRTLTDMQRNLRTGQSSTTEPPLTPDPELVALLPHVKRLATTPDRAEFYNRLYYTTHGVRLEDQAVTTAW